MSEQNYIQKIFAMRSNVLPDLAGALRIAKQGVAEYPTSAPLLCELGDLIQLAGEETDDLDDALGCYEMAAKRTRVVARHTSASATTTTCTHKTSMQPSLLFVRH